MSQPNKYALQQIVGDVPRRDSLSAFCENQAAYYAETILELPRPTSQDELVAFNSRSSEFVGMRKAWLSVMSELEKAAQ